MKEFISQDDLDKIHSIPALNKPITFFGSARLGCESPYYEQAKNLAYECVKAGFSVITGGGGGIMQAANEGAFKAERDLMELVPYKESESYKLALEMEKTMTPEQKAEIEQELQELINRDYDDSDEDMREDIAAADPKSIGFNIFLPFEQKGNDFLDYNITFKSLAIRKMALIEKSLAFVIFPGGFGTLDEFVEVLTLKQLGFKNVPIFAVGEQFWRGFDEFIKASLLPLKVISKGDELRYEITDDLNLILSKLKQLL